VAVVNQAFARKFFGNVDPIGKHFGQHDTGSEREYEIVGLAKDARYLTFQLDKPIAPLFFLPEAQHDFSPSAAHKDFNPGSHFMHDVVILTQPGASLPIAQVRQAMASIDSNIPILAIHTLKEQVAFSFTQQRLIARLTSFFGILSLLLASIGLYGVTAYNVGRRTSEIGVRVALGANRSDVFSLILRGALALISLGLLLGIPLALAAGRFLGNQLYGINQYNPLVIAISILALASSALIAALIPAFRATSISPLDALRTD
jgi:predicted lysophospholipase L1 biosynthesis ABC-type transport system permease subunit